MGHGILLMKMEALVFFFFCYDVIRSGSGLIYQTAVILFTYREFYLPLQQIPQGSILEPLLYLRESGAVCNKLFLYAGDSAILVADKNTASIALSLQTELEVVGDWPVENKLSLHLGKTVTILFGSKCKLRQQSELEISCKGTKIKSKESVKY